jgi:Fic family protein
VKGDAPDRLVLSGRGRYDSSELKIGRVAGESDSLAIAWEEVPWEPVGPVLAASQRERRDLARRTYRAAVPPSIEDLAIDLETDVAAQAEEARVEITRFDAELDMMIPGAEFAPLPSVLLRTESASSSQIENITSGARSLALAELGIAKHGSNAALVAHNVSAMDAAVYATESITPDGILQIHLALMEGQDYADPGRFRAEQVWIGGGPTPHSADFVPPHHSRVSAGITDLCAYARRNDVPLVQQAAIAHAQFETIHPFNDGNGRTGRALVHIILRNGGTTTRATVPVSAGLLRDTDSYFAALTAYREGDPNPIVSRFSEAAFAAIGNGRLLAQDLRRIHERWSEALAARQRSAARRALHHLLGRPAVTSATLQSSMAVSQPTADSVIRQLSQTGILTKASGVQRYTVWIAADVVNALDEFAARARRR